MQQVMFSWLVVGELRASAEWVGIVQTSSMLPALLLLPLGGAVADRFDPRSLLIRLHVIAALPPLVLAWVVSQGWLSIPGLVVYGMAMGTVMAFSIPARDSLLSRVAGSDLMRAVTATTIAQFGSQAVGTLLAGAARWTGTPLMLCLQAATLASGAITTAGVPRRSAEAAATKRPHAALESRPDGAALTEGLRFVLGSDIRGVLILLCGVGLLFMGPFLVVFPLLVRDLYGGDERHLSVVLMLFPIGTIAGSFVLLARGGIQRKGRALLIALSVGASMLVIIGQGLPFWGFLLATLCWGMAGAVFMNCSRTLFQQAAPAERRARVLSVYQLGFMGAGPLGALLAGGVAASAGPLPTLIAFGSGMLLLVAGVAVATRVPTLR